MGKLTVLRLFPEQTFEEKKKKTEETHILGIKSKVKDYEPTFSLGKSVFTETNISMFKFWKNPRKLVILMDGSFQTYSVDSKDDKPYISSNFGTLEERTTFTVKTIKKARAEMREMGNLNVVLIILLIVVLATQIMIMKGVRF